MVLPLYLSGLLIRFLRVRAAIVTTLKSTTRRMTMILWSIWQAVSLAVTA